MNTKIVMGAVALLVLSLAFLACGTAEKKQNTQQMAKEKSKKGNDINMENAKKYISQADASGGWKISLENKKEL